MRPRLLGGVSTLIAIAAISGCEAGLATPTNPGTIVVRVTDQGGAPMAGVQVTVSDIPNKVGSFYSVSQWTGADGTATIASVDAGLRRVTIDVPTGYGPDPQGTARQVEVIKGESVTVACRITRPATS